jgi:hypothetical protein
MIGEGLFSSQLNVIELVLKRLDLFESRNLSPDYSLGASHFRKMTYRQVWEECFRAYRYDFLLADRSLLTFEKGGQTAHNGELRYAYYECPYLVKTFDEFRREMMEAIGLQQDESSELDGMLRQDYEEYIFQCDTTEIVTPVRYDYKASDYRSGSHPASHIHFGHKSNIRVGTRRVMLPLSFVLLIVRQVYPDKWSKLLEWNDCNHLCRNVRESLETVHGDFWNHKDEKEVYLY